MAPGSRPGGALDDILLVDIGGGSTELVACARGEVSSSTSMDVGCVRVTERFLVSDPQTPEELWQQPRRWALLPGSNATSAIGVAGTITTRRARSRPREYDPERTHGHPHRAGGRRGAARPARGHDARGAALEVLESSQGGHPSSSPGS